jgi:hypothetical protein
MLLLLLSFIRSVHECVRTRDVAYDVTSTETSKACSVKRHEIIRRRVDFSSPRSIMLGRVRETEMELSSSNVTVAIGRDYVSIWSRGSSVSIVCGYGLDDLATAVRSPSEARDFSSNFCVQTGSGAHPASFTMGTEGPFPEGKARPGRDCDQSPHPMPRS